MIRAKKKDRVIIFGFSGSGKSTIANMVGGKTGLRVIHSSGVLRDLYGGQEPNMKRTRYARGFWETKKGSAFLKKRMNEDKPLDLILDKMLIRELDKGDLVLDCWSMPWLYKRGFKVYLKTSAGVRAGRVASRGKIGRKEALRLIKTKDEDTRRLIKKHYRIDIRKNSDIFDLTVNTDRLNKREVSAVILDALRKKYKKNFDRSAA